VREEEEEEEEEEEGGEELVPSSARIRSRGCFGETAREGAQARAEKKRRERKAFSSTLRPTMWSSPSPPLPPLPLLTPAFLCSARETRTKKSEGISRLPRIFRLRLCPSFEEKRTSRINATIRSPVRRALKFLEFLCAAYGARGEQVRVKRLLVKAASSFVRCFAIISNLRTYAAS